MSWVYLTISVGAAGFFLGIIIDSLNAFGRPQAQSRPGVIGDPNARLAIEAEQYATKAIKDGVEGLQNEIAELEKEMGELAKESRQKEKRRKPTKNSSWRSRRDAS